MYDYLEKELYRFGININNQFIYNNKNYSVKGILSELNLLPINLKNYNHLLYTDIYCKNKIKNVEEFKNAFKNVYNEKMYQYINLYLCYLNNTYNISFLFIDNL